MIDLFTQYPHPEFDGATYDVADKPRLVGTLAKVASLMADGRERTLAEIASFSGCSEAGASARLRDLRKPKFQAIHGSWKVFSRRTERGLWLYRIVPA